MAWMRCLVGCVVVLMGMASAETFVSPADPPAEQLPANATTFVSTPQAPPTGSRSAIQRLNMARNEQPKLYLPSRFFLGQQQHLTVQAAPNTPVTVYLSPQGKGLITDDGLVLGVGSDVETLQATTNDKGVAVIPVNLPDNPDLDGQKLYVDGFVAGDSPNRLRWVDPTGRDTTQNRVVMMLPSDGTGSTVLPGLPGGLGGSMLRRLGTYQDIQKGGDHLKELVDDGQRTGDGVYDRNSFTVRPDGTGGIK